MDRLIHTALNSLHNMRDSRMISAQNMANMNVPGFRRDLPNEGSARFLTALEAQTARAFQTERGNHAFSRQAGPLETTGDPMDLAIADQGYFYVQPPGGGEPALSRRGDLRLGPDGALLNGAGEPMLDAGGAPIVLPPFRSMTVNDVGQISIEPVDGAPGERVLAATLATVSPGPEVELLKSMDGRIRTRDGVPLPAPDQGARVLQGVREGSNVNATTELIASIELQRSFELNLRMIQTAQQLDEAGATALLRPPG